MNDITNDTQSLTTSRRRSGDPNETAQTEQARVVLTVKAKPAPIVQAPEADQRQLDIAARTDAEEGIRQGLADAKQGKLRPAIEFFEEFESVGFF